MASDVRLVTTEKDPYSWQYMPEAAHLFAKNLSDHSVNAYKQLCAGAGRTFEAVPSVHNGADNVLVVSGCPKPSSSTKSSRHSRSKGASAQRLPVLETKTKSLKKNCWIYMIFWRLRRRLVRS